MLSARIPLGYRYVFLMIALLGLLLGSRFLVNRATTPLPSSATTVITVKWTMTGLKVREMEDRVTSPYEHALSSLVDEAQGVESHTYDGLVIVKIFLRPGADLDRAYDQVNAASEYLQRQFRLTFQQSRDDT
jgi:multidrug efflux pump subunit AcrB